MQELLKLLALKYPQDKVMKKNQDGQVRSGARRRVCALCIIHRQRLTQTDSDRINTAMTGVGYTLYI